MATYNRNTVLLGYTMPALTAQYVITLYWSDGRYLQLKITAGSKEEAIKYASDFADRQYAESYTVEYIH